MEHFHVFHFLDFLALIFGMLFYDAVDYVVPGDPTKTVPSFKLIHQPPIPLCDIKEEFASRFGVHHNSGIIMSLAINYPVLFKFFLTALN